MGDKLVERAPYTYCLGTICHRTTKWVAARPLHETLNMGRGSTQRAAISDSVPDFLPIPPPPPLCFYELLTQSLASNGGQDDADFIAADEECGETRDMDDSSEDESDGEASSDVCSEEGSGLGGSDDDTDDGDVSDDQDRSEELRRLREGAEVCLQGGEGAR